AQAALMARGLVLVDQAAAGITVHDRLGGLVGGFGGGLVLRSDRVHDFLDRRAQHRARARIARVALDRLTRTLFGGFDVGQGKTPVKGIFGAGKRLGSLSNSMRWVNGEPSKSVRVERSPPSGRSRNAGRAVASASTPRLRRYAQRERRST